MNLNEFMTLEDTGLVLCATTILRNGAEQTVHSVQRSADAVPASVLSKVRRTPDGTMFTTGDWQSTQPQTLEEAQDFDWHKVDPKHPENTDAWTPAIWVAGRPVTIE